MGLEDIVLAILAQARDCVFVGREFVSKHIEAFVGRIGPPASLGLIFFFGWVGRRLGAEWTGIETELIVSGPRTIRKLFNIKRIRIRPVFLGQNSDDCFNGLVHDLLPWLDGIDLDLSYATKGEAC